MNASRMVITMIRRSYRTKQGLPRTTPNPGIQSRLNVLEDDAEHDFESMADMEMEDVEPDFAEAHQSYDSYKKELTKNKDLLKLRIVARKYFKEVEPSLLTYVEKEQIRYLHESDPLVYTPEQLSQSFPALPHTVRKILKAKWTPKSADRVLKHDQLVIENWKKFKRGELPLEPRLREHVKKFQGRMISLPNKEELEKKFIPPEKTFPKPKSQLYSGIIRSYLDQKKDEAVNNEEARNTDYKIAVDESSEPNDTMEFRSGSGQGELVSNPRFVNETALLTEKESLELRKTRSAKGRKDLVTLNKFFENSVKNIGSTPSIEDRVLMDTYKRKIESDVVKEKSTANDNRLRIENLDSRNEESNSVTVLTETDLQTTVGDYKKPESIKVFDDSKEMGLETYVKSWEKKASQDEHYPETITIPKNKYQKGKLYQLRDCYYDHDGEFLYRVPGLKD